MTSDLLLTELRRARGCTLVSVDRGACVHSSTLSLMERGRYRPAGDVALRRIARLFGWPEDHAWDLLVSMSDLPADRLRMAEDMITRFVAARRPRFTSWGGARDLRMGAGAKTPR